MARIPKNGRYVPALSLDPLDTGARYTVSRHRIMLCEKFGMDCPSNTAEQKQMLSILKAEDPEKYNKWFDVFVRNIELEKEVSEKIIGVNDEVRGLISEIFDKRANIVFNETDSKMSKWRSKIIDDVHFAISKAKDEVKKVVREIKVGDSSFETEAILPEEFDDILSLAANRINVMLIGPTGCGKSHISEIVAKALGLEFAAQSCSAGMSESIFSGWLLPTGANAKFEYVQSEFVRMYENGGVFLFDEIDASDSNTLLFINQALANGYFYLPQRFKNPLVKRHKDFVAMAAANTYGNGATSLYSGRNILDGATMDRFRMGVVEMDYSEKVESALIDDEILQAGRKVRGVINDKGLRRALSTRFMLDATKMKKSGWGKKKIFKSYFSDWNREEKKMMKNYVPEVL